jgi:hypothetical protein
MNNKSIFNSIRGNGSDQIDSLQVSNWKKNCIEAVGDHVGVRLGLGVGDQVGAVRFLIESEITSVK